MLASKSLGFSDNFGNFGIRWIQVPRSLWGCLCGIIVYSSRHFYCYFKIMPQKNYEIIFIINWPLTTSGGGGLSRGMRREINVFAGITKLKYSTLPLIYNGVSNTYMGITVIHWYKIMVIYLSPSLVKIIQLFFWIIFIDDFICILTGSSG